jgi:hypothetical protein
MEPENTLTPPTEQPSDVLLALVFVEFRTRSNALTLVRADTITGFTMSASGPQLLIEQDEAIPLHPSWTLERFKSDVLGGLNMFLIEDTYAIRSV